MQKFIAVFLSLIILFAAIEARAADCGLGDRLAGRILIQAEANGEAWYVDPRDKNRVYLGRPADAFALMREHSLGVTEKDFQLWQRSLPVKYRGYMILRAEAEGQAYYADPASGQLLFLGRPDDAFALMRKAGLGISNRDLGRIKIAPILSRRNAAPPRASADENREKALLPASPTEPAQNRDSEPVQKINSEAEMEEAVWDAINSYRQEQGLPRLAWNSDLADIARRHSADMAAGRTPFSHNGFDERLEEAAQILPLRSMGENLAYNYNIADPIEGVIRGWLNSQGHRRNIIGNYDVSGVGIARAANGNIYFTQLFLLRK